jgi:hypothetical protein
MEVVKIHNNFINNLVTIFFDLQLNMKLYHWNTPTYPRHIASDKFGSEFCTIS